MPDNFFSEFPPASKEQWKQRVLKELKDEPYDKLILNKDGLIIEPYYTKEEILPVASPGKKNNHWQIRQDFLAADFKNTNKKILKALEHGVDAIGLRFDNECSEDDLADLLQAVFLDMVSIHFIADAHADSVFNAFVQVAEKRNYNTKTLTGSFNTDPLCENGNPDFTALKKQLKRIALTLPLFKTITIHVQPLQSKTDSMVEELVLTLLKAHQCFTQLTNVGFDKNMLASQMQFFVPVGTEYFFEIAKLRALRALWSKLLAAHGINHATAFIQAQKSWNQNDNADPYKNILRHTTEAMSAIIGGCDVLNLRSTDKTETLSNDFFERISVNIQHILKHESHFDKVSDPAAGSYYIEALTQQLTDAAWSQFNELKQKSMS
jgi:methylmalonyl-CoA mutase